MITKSTPITTTKRAPSPGRVFPLENGEHLTRQEFERRYESMPQLKKAELIEGIVYMSSPVSRSRHGKPHANLMTWLGHYAAASPGTELLDNATIRLDLSNEPQPDAVLRILPEVGGQSRDTADDFVEGAPELAAEVVASSGSYDLHEKKAVYRRNRVLEYLAWITTESRIIWWHLRDEEYIELSPDERGILYSQVFPGLWLDAAAMLRFDLPTVLATLQRGINSDGHQIFLKALSAKAPH